MTVELDQLVDAVRSGHVRVTEHALRGMEDDDLSLDAVIASLMAGEVIEQYPTDRPFPSCLVFGAAPESVPVHSVWAYNAASEWCALITVYRPDPDRRIDMRTRKTR